MISNPPIISVSKIVRVSEVSPMLIIIDPSNPTLSKVTVFPLTSTDCPVLKKYSFESDCAKTKELNKALNLCDHYQNIEQD